MNLYIKVNNVEISRNLKKYLDVNVEELEQKFKNKYFWEVENEISPQYKAYINSLKQIRKLYWTWEKLFNNIKGFYIWNEQCEFLMPTLQEFKEIISNLKKDFWSKKKFVLVTPYWWHKVIEKRIIEILDYIEENIKEFNTFQMEVVANSYWLIQLIKEKWYKKIRLIWGPLLTKHFKAPVFELYEGNALSIPWRLLHWKTEDEKKEIYKKILDNNLKEFNKAVWHNEYFVKLLKKYKINRVSQYWLKEYKEIFKWINWLFLDIYYPFILTTTWRLCHTSMLEDDYKRWYYATNKVCSRTCKKYNMLLNNFDDHLYKLHQMWNAIYKIYNDLTLEWTIPAETMSKNTNRLIYTPIL